MEDYQLQDLWDAVVQLKPDFPKVRVVIALELYQCLMGCVGDKVGCIGAGSMRWVSWSPFKLVGSLISVTYVGNILH